MYTRTKQLNLRIVSGLVDDDDDVDDVDDDDDDDHVFVLP